MLQAKISAANAKLQATQERAKAAAEATKQEMDAKIKSLKEQVAKAQGAAKAELEARIAEVQSEYKRRADKLHQAWELTKEALAICRTQEDQLNAQAGGSLMIQKRSKTPVVTSLAAMNLNT